MILGILVKLGPFAALAGFIGYIANVVMVSREKDMDGKWKWYVFPLLIALVAALVLGVLITLLGRGEAFELLTYEQFIQTAAGWGWAIGGIPAAILAWDETQ